VREARTSHEYSNSGDPLLRRRPLRVTSIAKRAKLTQRSCSFEVLEVEVGASLKAFFSSSSANHPIESYGIGRIWVREQEHNCASHIGPRLRKRSVPLAERSSDSDRLSSRSVEILHWRVQRVNSIHRSPD